MHLLLGSRSLTGGENSEKDASLSKRHEVDDDNLSLCDRKLGSTLRKPVSRTDHRQDSSSAHSLNGSTKNNDVHRRPSARDCRSDGKDKEGSQESHASTEDGGESAGPGDEGGGREGIRAANPGVLGRMKIGSHWCANKGQ